MENRVPRLPGAKKKSFPMFLRIVCVTVICAGLSGLALFFLLSERGHRFFQSANTVSEYLTAQEFSIDANETPAVSFAATALPTAEPTAESTDDRISISQYASLQLGDNNAAVAELQQRFMELGYMEGDEPDTLYNESTQNAVMLFQRANNVPMTGIATAELQQMLFSDHAQEYRIKLNDDGSDVKGIQRRLSYLGYYSDRITGYYGPQTEHAVMLFQSKNGININGQISRTDWDLLYSDAVVELSTPSPSPSPTPSPTPKPTAKPTLKATPTAKATATPKSTASHSATSSPKATATPKDTVAPNVTETPSLTSSPVSTEAASEAAATVQPTEAPTVAPDTPTPKPTPKQGEEGSYGHSVSEFIRCAEAQLGDPYILGDEGPGSFDCSGLVYYCLNKCGVKVGRLNAYSYSNKESWTKIESVDDLQRGDLLFFKSDKSEKVNHAAIYLGGGRFIHASASKGEVVYSSFGPYWDRNFVCGRRVF